MKKEWCNTIYDMIGFMALLNWAVMIWQTFGMWVLTFPLGQHKVITTALWNHVVFLDGTSFHVLGLLDNPNVSAAFLALSVPVFFRKKWLLGLPFVLQSLVMLRCDGGIVPGFFVVLLWLFLISPTHYHRTIYGRHVKIYDKRFALYFGLFVLLCTFVVLLPHLEGMSSGRFSLWRKILRYVIVQRPIIGEGLGQWKIIAPLFPTNIADWKAVLLAVKTSGTFNLAYNQQVHNEYLQLWVETGGIGVTLFMAYVLNILYKTKKTSIAFLGMIVAGINSGVFFLFHTTVCLIPILYLIILEKEESCQNLFT